MDWVLVIVFFVVGLINVRVALWVDSFMNKRRDMKFLRYVQIRFPDQTSVVFVATEATPKEALEKIKEQLDELP